MGDDGQRLAVTRAVTVGIVRHRCAAKPDQGDTPTGSVRVPDRQSVDRLGVMPNEPRISTGREPILTVTSKENLFPPSSGSTLAVGFFGDKATPEFHDTDGRAAEAGPGRGGNAAIDRAGG